MATISVIGYPAAGKTHFLALLYLHLNRMQARDRDIRMWPEATSPEFDIVRQAALLRDGIPLSPTGTRDVYRANLNIQFPGLLRSSHKQIPLLDTAGEVLRIAMQRLTVNDGLVGSDELERFLDEQQISKQQLVDMHAHVFQADAFCFLFNTQQELKQRQGTYEYTQFFNNLMNFRQLNKIPVVRDVCLVFSKYESARLDLAARLQGQVEPINIARYLAPDLFGAIEARLEKRPRVLLTSTEWLIEPQPKASLTASAEEREGRFRRKVDPVVHVEVPDYSEAAFDELVKWIHDL